MAPLKVKLSLSSAKESANTATPSSSQKGKGKAEVVTSRNAGPGVDEAKTAGKPDRQFSLRQSPNVADTPQSVRPESPSSEAGPSTMHVLPPAKSRPKAANANASPSTPAQKSTKQSKGASKSKAKPPARSRPSAIPPRLLSQTPTTPKPMPPPSLPETPPAAAEVPVKLEWQDSPAAASPSVDDGSPSADPISLPLSPAGMMAEEAATPGRDGEGEVDTPTTRGGKTGGRWLRTKRPLRELVTKIIGEMKRKDEYNLFGEPVDLEAYPDYLDSVGGEDKMMDFSTMQAKADNEEYRGIEDFQTDLQTLVTAAQTFNPAGTVPYNAAVKILNIGMKHIDRSRDLVLTPPPSRANSATPWLDREPPNASGSSSRPQVHPFSYIPDEMLRFPPGSAAAKLVGWNLNGGKRVYAKRIIRGREKFTGKWRHWDLDGSRDIAEMDEPELVFDGWKASSSSSSSSIPGSGQGPPRVIDWWGLRKESWWEVDGIGGSQGQPPLAPALIPLPPPVKERELGVFEWGAYPEIEAELLFLSHRTGMSDLEALAEHLRPLKQRSKGPQPAKPNPPNYVNLYEDPMGRSSGDWLRDVAMGDLTGEAYLSSVERFVKGAMDGVKERERERDSVVKSEGEEAPKGVKEVKVEVDSEEVKPGIKVGGEEKSDPTRLDQYIRDHYHSGILSLNTSHRGTILNTTKQLQSLRQCLATGHPIPPDLQKIHTIAQRAYARVAMRALTVPTNPLDMEALLFTKEDFMHQGVTGRAGIAEGFKATTGLLTKAIESASSGGVNGTVVEGGDASVGLGQKRKREDGEMDISGEGKRAKVKLEKSTRNGVESGSSSPLTAVPDSPSPTKRDNNNNNGIKNGDANGGVIGTTGDGKAEEDEHGLRELRLELVSLAKFYPLAALKKMDKASAERLLPSNVRGLMSV